jgi:hypothetical protein
VSGFWIRYRRLRKGKIPEASAEMTVRPLVNSGNFAPNRNWGSGTLGTPMAVAHTQVFLWSKVADWRPVDKQVHHHRAFDGPLSGISIANVAWKPVVAAGCMAGHLARPVGRHGILSGVPATPIYGIYGYALLALAIRVSWG